MVYFQPVTTWHVLQITNLSESNVIPAVSAATYDIVTELRALLFIVNCDHFTINIVNEKRSG